IFAKEAGAVSFAKKANGRTYVSVNPITEAAE
ncbi:MAG: 50S ribosomal protein L27, partial [Nitratireductor sp.]